MILLYALGALMWIGFVGLIVAVIVSVTRILVAALLRL